MFGRSFARFLTATALGLLGAQAATAAPVLTLHDALGQINSLRLGDDLWVSVSGGTPSTTYQLRLTDATGFVIKTQTVVTNAVGGVSPVLLWQHSGVVGCDANSNPTYSAWRFERFEEAELRHGETLILALATPTGPPAAQRTVPLYADTATPRFYLSDANACPRFQQDTGFTYWLSGIHIEGFAGSTRQLWIVDASLPASTPLVDLRPGYASGQTFQVPPTLWGQALVQVTNPPWGSFFWGTVEPWADPPPQDGGPAAVPIGGTCFMFSQKPPGGGPGSSPGHQPCPPCEPP